MEEPKLLHRLFWVSCSDHGTDIGEVWQSKLGAYFVAGRLLSGKDSWGDRLSEERKAFRGRAPGITANVGFLIDAFELADDEPPPAWMTTAPSAWCQVCRRWRAIDPSALRRALAEYRSGKLRQMLA
jgi:hypothetical protein